MATAPLYALDPNYVKNLADALKQAINGSPCTVRPESGWKPGDRFRSSYSMMTGYVLHIGDGCVKFRMDAAPPGSYEDTSLANFLRYAERLESAPPAPRERTCTNKWCAVTCDVGHSCWRCGAPEVSHGV